MTFTPCEILKPSYEQFADWGWFGIGDGIGLAIAGAVAILMCRKAA